MRAIILDFYGTLTDPDVEATRRDGFVATATALGVEPDRFCAAMAEDLTPRITGLRGDTRAMLLAMARQCGVEPDPARLDTAVATHFVGSARARRPRDGVFEVLRALRDNGFELAVLSDCGSELVERWPELPFAPYFAATVFSWREGYRKPDPRLYATAAERLGVAPGLCWYVGDGGSREHRGALTAGMRPVLVANTRHPGAAAHRDDPDDLRPEHVVDDLTDLVGLVGATDHR